MKTRHFTLALAVLALLLGNGIDTQAKTNKKKTKRAASTSSKNTSKKTASKSSKRSASSKKGLRSASSKRAASTSNSRRAAATGRSSARAAATGRSSVRAAATRKGVTSTASSVAKNTTVETTSVETTSVENQCPVGQLVRKAYDEDGNETYYKTKSATCNMPENAVETVWDMVDAKKLKQYTLKKGWIDESEAVSFVCDSGYLTVNRQCKSFDEFCPINEIIEKSGKSYINPYTGDSCISYTGVTATRLTDAENNSDIPTSKAYRLTCPSGYYTNTDNYISCSQCPSDKPYSIKGSNIGVKSCSVVTDASSCPDGQWMGNGEKECKEYNYYTFTDVENVPEKGTFGIGLYTITSEGSNCAKSSNFVATKDTKFAKVQDSTGSYFAVDGKILLDCATSATFKLKKANGSEGIK